MPTLSHHAPTHACLRGHYGELLIKCVGREVGSWALRWRERGRHGNWRDGCSGVSRDAVVIAMELPPPSLPPRALPARQSNKVLMKWWGRGTGGNTGMTDTQAKTLLLKQPIADNNMPLVHERPLLYIKLKDNSKQQSAPWGQECLNIAIAVWLHRKSFIFLWFSFFSFLLSILEK